MKKIEFQKLAIQSAVLTMSLTFALSLESRAQTPQSKGFNPFAASGTAPAAKPAAGGKPAPKTDDMFEFDEDDTFGDDEVDDISDEILRQRMEQRLKEKAGGAGTPSFSGAGGSPGGRGGVDFGQAGAALGNTSLAGGASTKTQSGPKGPGCLKLDPYTGYGPDVITNFDFPDADIVEIAKTLGRLTCLNFILEKDVKGRISIVSNSSITVGEAWKAFLTSLDVNGFTIIPSGTYLRIARHRDAKDKQIKTYTGDYSPDSDLLITRVLPLKYISSEEVARVFRNFQGANTRILPYEQTNTVILTDTGANVKKIVDMIQLLDVEGYDEGLEVIRIKYASATDIAKLIDQLLPGSQGTGPGTPGGVPRFRGAGGFTARKTKEGGVISHIIPDERTNAVIVSANAKGLEQVKQLITKLDSKVSMSQGGSKIHVVYLQYADAEQVAQTLNNLAQSGGGAVKPVGTPGAPATTAALFEGSIKISADKPTNSLVITGTPSDFLTVSRVISKLDVQRDQVYVEAIIMEMVLDRGFELGTSIALPNAGVGFQPNDDLGKFLLNPFSLPGLVLGLKSGASKTISVPGTNQSIEVNSITGLIKALQSNTNSNVLATPQLLTLDNQEASIEIAENVPIPTQTTIANAGVQNSITREKIALSLKIKPQINKISNFVKLDIDQKLDDISGRTLPKGVADLAFATASRQSKTTVVVQDGDTVAMGGLVRDTVSEKTTKVPLLGDIPLLGWLFRSKSSTSLKQNLLVFITPQIVKQYQNMRKILDKKIRQRDEFIERAAGGEDPHIDYKLDMIKNLPPVSELRTGARIENGDIEGLEQGDERTEDSPANTPDAKAPGSTPVTVPAPIAPTSGVKKQ